MTDFNNRGQAEFELTEEHLKLMRRSFVDFDADSYDTGSFIQNPKRPYGNSDVVEDLYELLVDPAGWDCDAHDDKGIEEADPALAERLLKTHRELATAVSVVLTAQSFELGLYRTTKMYDGTSWEKIK